MLKKKEKFKSYMNKSGFEFVRKITLLSIYLCKQNICELENRIKIIKKH
jgi:hypothetical protein